MKPSINKIIKTGYGLGLLTAKQAKQVATTIKRDLDLNDQESQRLATELVANSHRAAKEVLDVVEKHVKVALTKSGIVSAREYQHAKKTLLKRIKKQIKRKVKPKKESILRKVKRKVLHRNHS